MGMAFGLVEANPFDSLRFSRLLRVRTDESKAAGRGSEAEPQRIKGDYLPKSKRHAHSKWPVRGRQTLQNGMELLRQMNPHLLKSNLGNSGKK